MSKHNAADVFNKQSDYTSEIKKNNYLFMLQSKLKVMRTIIFESFKSSRRKLNEANCVKYVSDVFILMGCKSIIRDESEMNWHKLPESSMKKFNEADCVEYINNITALMRYKLII